MRVPVGVLNPSGVLNGADSLSHTRAQCKNLETDKAAETQEIPHTGVSIAGENYSPAEASALVRAFVKDTLQNSNYENKENLERRAKNFFKHIESEMAICLGVEKDLQRDDSPVSQLSSHMAHLVRGLWMNAQSDPVFREQLHRELLAPSNDPDRVLLAGEGKGGLYLGMKHLHAMLVKGEQGPLTREDAQQGAEMAFGIKAMAEAMRSQDSMLAGLDAYTAKHRVGSNRVVDGVKTHHFTSPHGTDLRNDLGTQIRDQSGVPVMLGTSGGASDVASTLRHAAESQQQPMWPSGMSENQGREAMMGLVFHLMRHQVTDNAQAFYDKMRRDLHGLPSKKVEPTLIFSHSFPEVVTGVEMTLNNEKPTERDAMIRSTQLAKVLLDKAFADRDA
ncbi:hypothetical protein [Pseudomonas mucidolens]|uniref:Uncharacterized protein n=1 Tax=Pseudomonas mucidolens TaxID=46679 RepID=A0A1H2LUW8_9PSED|nr:hypothetical protein [Pseudomonas mucidolens]SDU84810.1 hypothetical protein SAMN05216202_0513 [Pseudomonas mucidolens]SQH35243.1 Uncharacterised protein [Pseudomonas mucidolens]